VQATLDARRVPSLGRELALLELEDGDGLLEPGERWVDRWDQRDDLVEDLDLGWLGEDREGIWLQRHPDAALVEDEALWWPVHEWQLGHREVSAEDRATLSNWQVEALLSMMSADAREQRRQVRRRSSDGKESEG
jgi:hypothetical protein